MKLYNLTFIVRTTLPGYYHTFVLFQYTIPAIKCTLLYFCTIWFALKLNWCTLVRASIENFIIYCTVKMYQNITLPILSFFKFYRNQQQEWIYERCKIYLKIELKLYQIRFRQELETYRKIVEKFLPISFPVFSKFETIWKPEIFIFVDDCLILLWMFRILVHF